MTDNRTVPLKALHHARETIQRLRTQLAMANARAAGDAAAALTVNALGAKPIHYYSAGAWRAVPASLWDTDEIFRVAYNSAAGAYRLTGFRHHTGEVRPY